MLSLCGCLLGLCLLTLLPATTVTNESCKTEYIFLKFRTAEPAENIKRYFENVTVMYSFKVYGAGHYIFIIHDDNNQNLRKLALPADASTTVSTFPVETVQTYLGRFGIDVRINQTRVPDEGLTFVEVTWDISSVIEEQYRAMLVKAPSGTPQLDVPLKILQKLGKAGFVAVSTLPTKFIYFRTRDKCGTPPVFTETSAVKSRTLRIHNL
ncbi:uncharacterized protein LOC143292071 [Babylonia areolata]|uniref:uncharacterized protein LOC143292071 n=1 Tax=Babylonia areolata TaxID=304850 RepID=UPI003FD10E30